MIAGMFIDGRADVGTIHEVRICWPRIVRELRAVELVHCALKLSRLSLDAPCLLDG